MEKEKGLILLHLIIKRIFDLVFSIIGILILIPCFVIIAICIKINSSGPVFFIQDRLGINGKVFRIIKFRSMIINAEFTGTGLFNYSDDPRVTKVGKFLRDLSLDELPQIFNIFKGDMSFVGPRPPVVYELGSYSDFDATLKRRFKMKPGITGYAQITGRNELSWDEKIKFDNEYITDFSKWGLVVDLKVIFVTAIKVLKNEGGYELQENAEKDLARMINNKDN